MFNMFESKQEKMAKKLLFGTEKERNEVLNSKEFKKIVKQSIKNKEVEKNNPPKYWGVLLRKETKTHWPNCVVCGFRTIEEMNKHSDVVKDDKGNSIYFENSSQASSYRDDLIKKLDLGYMVGYAKSTEEYLVLPLLGMLKEVSDKCEIYRTKFGADNAAVNLNNEIKKEIMLDVCKKCIDGMTCTKICDKFFNETEGKPFSIDMLDFINRVGDKDANNIFLDIFKKAERCLMCEHENIVMVHTEGDVCMEGYCEKCQTLYIKDNEITDGMFGMAVKEEHSSHEDIPKDYDGKTTFKDAIKFWKKIGAI